MTETTFAYWLKGFFEISGTNDLTQEQVKIIKDHLDLVFNKVTPEYTYYNPNEVNYFAKDGNFDLSSTIEKGKAMTVLGMDFSKPSEIQTLHSC